MKKAVIKRIMVFGRPGSGKSTFSDELSKALNLPLHHLDKHFYEENWAKRDYSEFLEIQQNIVNSQSWVIDGNCTKSFEMRWAKSDLVLYFNFPKPICYFRVFKRFFKPNAFDDRAFGCFETIQMSLLKYMWSFEKRVKNQVVTFQGEYSAIFKEIKNDHELKELKVFLNIK